MTSIPHSLVFIQVQIQMASTLTIQGFHTIVTNDLFCMTFKAVKNHFIDCWDRFPFVCQKPRFYKQAIIHIEATLIRSYCGDLRQILLYTISSQVNTSEQTTTRHFSRSGKENEVFYFIYLFISGFHDHWVWCTNTRLQGHSTSSCHSPPQS